MHIIRGFICFYLIVAMVFVFVVFFLLLPDTFHFQLIPEDEINTGTDECIYCSTFVKNGDTFNEYFYNITSYLEYSREVSILDGDESCVGHDNREKLLKSLYHNYNVSIFFATIGNFKHKYQKRKKYDKFISIEVSSSHILFIISSSLDSFMDNLDYIPLIKVSTSFIVITFTSQTIENITCESVEFQKDIQNYVSDLFLILWKTYRCLEVTIWFPKICGQRIILRYDPILKDAERYPILGINNVSDEEIKTNRYALRHKYSNFQGHQLNVKIFPRTPTYVAEMPDTFSSVYLHKDVEKYGNIGGIDAFILYNMAKYMNFTLLLSNTEDKNDYGWIDNGTFLGTLGDIVYNKANISFNARFFKYYETNSIDFTFPTYMDELCILVPKANKIPKWMNIFQGFNPITWLMYFLTVMFCGAFWWLLLKSREKIKKLLCSSYFSSTITFSFLFFSQPIFVNNSKFFRERIFITCCLFFNIVFTGCFQGYLFKAYRTTEYYPEIETLNQLDDCELPVVSSSLLSDVFGSEISPLNTRLGDRMRKSTKPALQLAAYDRDVAAVERKSDAVFLIKLNYTNDDGSPLLHIVRQCPRTFYLTYIVHKGYPFLLSMNRYLRKVVEGGLPKFWYDMTVYSLTIHKQSQIKDQDDHLSLSVVDIQTAFFALSSGLLISFSVFILELLIDFHSQGT